MSDLSPQGMAERESRNLLTIWVALVFSIGVYVLLGSIFAGAGEPVSVSRATVELGSIHLALSTVRWGVIVGSLGLLFAAGWVSHHFLIEHRILAHSEGRTPEERLRSGFAYLKFYTLLSWGLAESVILVGTLWAIVSGQQLAVFPFAIAGGTALFILKPEQPSLLQLGDRMSKAPRA